MIQLWNPIGRACFKEPRSAVSCSETVRKPFEAVKNRSSRQRFFEINCQSAEEVRNQPIDRKHDALAYTDDTRWLTQGLRAVLYV